MSTIMSQAQKGRKEMLTSVLLLIGFAVIALIFGTISLTKMTRKQKVVNSFEDCIEAGFPIMESYPRQCRTPDGKNFTEILDPID